MRTIWQALSAGSRVFQHQQVIVVHYNDIRNDTCEKMTSHLQQARSQDIKTQLYHHDQMFTTICLISEQISKNITNCMYFYLFTEMCKQMMFHIYQCFLIYFGIWYVHQGLY